MSSHASRVGAAILAAGDSSRMGTPKALLEVNGQTFLETIFGSVISAGLDPVRIVVGAHGGAIAKRHPEMQQLFLRNLAPEHGQLSSLRIALADMAKDINGLLVCLIDHPRVSTETIRDIVGAWRTSGKAIVIPAYNGKRGHPVLFGWQVFGELLTMPLKQGAKPVVRSRPERVLELAVDDPAVLEDIDTPEEYERLQGDV